MLPPPSAMLPRLSPLHVFVSLLFLQAAVPTSAAAASSSRHIIRVITVDDLAAAADDSAAPSPAPAADESPEWDDFVDPDTRLEEELDPGSWRAVLEPQPNATADADPRAALYASGIGRLMSAVSAADLEALQAAVRDLEESAASGYPHAQSAVGFLYGSRILTTGSAAKAFIHHQFAAKGGDAQSKLALAYTYYRQEMYDEAIDLYAELAEAAVASFLISKDQPAIEIVKIHSGSEENKEALRKAQGVEDEAFQVTEHQALRGHAAAMYKMGMFYYFGLRGVRKDYKKALYWFSKAVEKGEPKAMELLGEIYARGAGAEKNYTEALKWLTLASKQKHFSAYNGLGYLYVKGYGVEKKNYTKAREYFEKAAANDEAGGFYNLGVLYLKGIGVKRDVAFAGKCFTTAASVGQPKALYQVAKMFQKGIGLKKNIVLATTLYKLVAEKGPWSSLSKWGLESYAKGDMGKALLLYLRMAELGYEVAQSNAAWLLDKFGENSLCIGKAGFCTSAERHLLAHSLWWQATEQGNEHAALLIGDAYYYGRGTERDYERAAEAYMHARSQSNAQAMFNLGYMHERGEGIPLDFHLAKRYYDQALAKDQDARLAVTIALISLWIRKNYAGSYMVELIDSLPHFFPRVKFWVDQMITGEENIMIITLFVSLLTILYVRERRRHVAPPFPQPNEGHD